jgi:hypothetical protein
MGLFGFSRRRRPPRDLQSKLDDLTVEARRVQLDERIARNQYLHRAAERDPLAAAQIAFSGRAGGRHANPIQTREPLGDKVVEQLVLGILKDRDDDPALKIARLRRAALEDRALRRVMEADDDDDGEEGGGSIVRDVMVALATAVAGAMAPQLASYAPAVAAKLQAATGSAPAAAASTTPRLGAPQPPAGGPMSTGNVSPLLRIKVRYVLRQLDQQTPEDFAAWALGQPAAESMLIDLADTPDADLPALLADAIADPSTAEWHDVLQWLADHPNDARRIVAEIRRRLDEDAAADETPAPPVEPSTAEAPPKFATGGW